MANPFAKAWDWAKDHPYEIGGTLLGGPMGYLAGAGVEELTGGSSAISDIAGSGFFSPSEQTTSNAPWEQQQPFLEDIFQQSQDLYNQGGQLTPPLSGMTNQYMQGVQGQLPGSQDFIGGGQGVASNIAGGGLSPLSGGAGDYLRNAAGGGFVGKNPYLDETFNRAAGQVGQQFQNFTQPGINQAFGGSAGAFGSGAHQGLLGQAQENLGGTLGGLATDIYGGAYRDERGLQQGAAGMLGSLGMQDINSRLSATGQMPGLNQAGYFGLNQLGGAGQYQDIFNQTQSMDDWNRLGLYGQNVGGNYGGTQTGPGPSPFDQFLDPAAKIATIATPFVTGGPK